MPIPKDRLKIDLKNLLNPGFKPLAINPKTTKIKISNKVVIYYFEILLKFNFDNVLTANPLCL